MTISIYNYSEIRYSLPLFFASYLFLLGLNLSNGSRIDYSINKVALNYFYIYLALSLVFLLFFDFSQTLVGDRFRGFTGSPTTYSAIITIVYLIWDGTNQKWTLKRIILFSLLFYLVFLSKTRLLLIFLLLYPFILYIMGKKKLKYRLVFVSAVVILFFIYPLYGVVVDYFPQLVSLRYQDGRDASFGLRYHLYNINIQEYFNGNWAQMLFGRGNEFSRLFVLEKMGGDLFPHNDFVRILLDWGAIGLITFLFILYKIAITNRTVLMISLVYLVLFYSNMVFSLFIISILMLLSIPNWNLKNE